MGAWLSYLWWGGDPDAPDEVSGLSLRDLHLVRTSWRPIYKLRLQYGTEILKRMYRAEPETRRHFRMLDGVSDEELAGAVALQAHVITLMGSLDSVVGALDAPSLATAMLRKLGESHARRKIPKSHFEVLRGVMVSLLTEQGADRNVLAAWSRALAFMYSHITPLLQR